MKRLKLALFLALLSGSNAYGFLGRARDYLVNAWQKLQEEKKLEEDKRYRERLEEIHRRQNLEYLKGLTKECFNSKYDNGRSELVYYLRHGFDSTALELIERGAELGADFNIKDDFDMTPLHHARSEAVVIELIKNSADVNAKDRFGHTPLQMRDLSEGAVEALLKAGADPNPKGTFGETPLHRAWNEDVAKVLLEGGADPNVKNTSGETPLHNADKYRVKLLVDAGAKHRPSAMWRAWREKRPEVAKAIATASVDKAKRDLEKKATKSFDSRSGTPADRHFQSMEAMF